MSRIYIGYTFGSGRAGDDGIVARTIERLKSELPGAEIIVTSASQREYIAKENEISIPSVHSILGFDEWGANRNHLSTAYNRIAGFIWHHTGLIPPSRLGRHARVMSSCDVFILLGDGTPADAITPRMEASRFLTRMCIRLSKAIALMTRTLEQMGDPSASVRSGEPARRVTLVAGRDEGLMRRVEAALG